MAAWLYLGAGIGMLLLRQMQKRGRREKFAAFTRAERPYILGMVLLDILAPALLMFGLRSAQAANAALLNNFEIVATALIALVVFKEAISPRLWTGIFFVTLASVLLSIENSAAFRFSTGSLLVLAASLAWGLENNFTRRLSNRGSSEIVIIKGLGSGLGSLLLALIAREAFPQVWLLALTMLLGFVAYGLSINFYVKAQKELGAAKTSAYYAFAPFIGVFLALLIFPEMPAWNFWIGLLLMGQATWFLITDSISIQHTHEHFHTRLVRLQTAQGVRTYREPYRHSHYHAHQTKSEGVHEHIH